MSTLEIDSHLHTSDSDGDNLEYVVSEALEMHPGLSPAILIPSDHARLEGGTDEINEEAYNPDWYITGEGSDEWSRDDILDARGHAIDDRNRELLRNYCSEIRIPDGGAREQYRDFMYGDRDLDAWDVLDLEDGFSPPLFIVKGLELDIGSGQEEEIRDFVAGHRKEGNLEAVTGAAHYIDGMYIRYGDFSGYPGPVLEELVEQHFREIGEALGYEEISAVAHPDLVELDPNLRRYVSESHYEDLVDVAVDTGTPLELNARTQKKKWRKADEETGYSRDDAETYPGILMESNAPFTAASDNHSHEKLEEEYRILSRYLEENPFREPASLERLVGDRPGSGNRSTEQASV